MFTKKKKKKNLSHEQRTEAKDLRAILFGNDGKVCRIADCNQSWQRCILYRAELLLEAFIL
jgi:hypothetical protein